MVSLLEFLSGVHNFLYMSEFLADIASLQPSHMGMKA
uniref:Uncharacterized protein n=1 Tax=Utricularia reniformis TaxID=192314 RepID=A0A1Y0B4A9_9LAMI|nr:hypothetical protein AEK19_MT2072 [Utricularia reniformis]ART32228.1 hypothetical protein AEK19_MT2072 [Utricularia reniformis]